MGEKKTGQDDYPDFREPAEKAVRRQAVGLPENHDASSPEEMRRAFYELKVHQIELEMQNEELRRARDELEAAQARYVDLYDQAPVGYCTVDEKGVILEANRTIAAMLGVERSALVKESLSRFIVSDDQDIYYLCHKRLRDSRISESCELRMTKRDEPSLWVMMTASALQTNKGEAVFHTVIADITKRKEAELRQSLWTELMEIISGSHPLTETIDTVLASIKRKMGFDAVGLRLRMGEDFPYFVQNGFTDDFLRTENTLALHDPDGGLCRGDHGNISLECTCGLVISGQTDPMNPFFTRGGSFWTNDAATLLDLPADRDPRLHTRNRCIHEGFRSIALIPVRAKREIVGLLQINDRQEGRLTPDLIRYFEGLGASIGIALIRRQAEEELRGSEEYFKAIIQNASDIILIVDRRGTVTYASPSIERFLGYGPDEWIGKRSLDLIVAEDKPRAVEDFAKALQTKDVSVTNVFRARHKDGAERILEGIATNLLDNPFVAGFVMNIRDITERTWAEQEKVIIAEIGRMIGSTLDIDEVYDRFAAEVRKLISFDRIHVNLTDPDGESFSIVYASGADIAGRSPGDHVPMAGTVSETVIRTRTGLFLCLEGDEEMVSRSPATFAASRAGMRSAMGVPLISRNEVIGCLHFRSKKKNAYTEQDLRLAEKIGAQIAGAIANAQLFGQLKQEGQEHQRTIESLRRACGTTIRVMASAVETRDPYTAGHQTRSADLARAIATEMGLPQEKIDAIRMSGTIHDIGKLSIPAEILSKPTKLSEIEFSLIKEHARKGYEMLKDVESPWPLAEIVHQHHERMDGSGYPRSLKGDEICIEARVLNVADVVEAMASHRPYRPSLGIDAALNEIEKNRGLGYDNAVVDACLRLFREKGFQFSGT